MKTRVTFFLIFLSLFLLMQSAFSGTWTNTANNAWFDLSGTTTSTSSHLPGMTGQAQYWEATGSASMSDKASASKAGNVYECEMWLEVASDELTSVPSRDNIDKSKQEGKIYKHVYTKGYGSVLYKKHAVGSASNLPVAPGTYRASQLTDSLSAPSYSERNYTSPTGLCASPYAYGILSGEAQKAGNVSVDALSLRSKDNEACANSPETASPTVKAEICRRRGLCQKPGTATTDTSHRVACPEDRWVYKGFKVLGHRFFPKQQDCEGVWWTCDDRADVCPLTGSHVPASEKSWKQKYVAPDGSASQYPPKQSKSASLSSSSSSVSTYESVTLSLTTATPFRMVYWYIASASNSGLGSNVQANSGSSTAKSTSLSYSFSSSGNYKITAYIYNYSDSSTYQTSSTVSVSAPAIATNNNNNGNSGNGNSGNGNSGNSNNGNSGGSTPPPPPPPPTTVSCVRSACTTSVSRRWEHRVDSCSNCGNGYWTCGSHASRHTDLKTCRRSGCGQSWYTCAGKPASCQSSTNRCWAL